MTYNQKALEAAVLAGKILLENGAEITRVHGTIVRFLESLGIGEHHVYVVSNGIFVTIDESGSAPCNAVRHVLFDKTHLGRIAAVNELSREVARTGAQTDLNGIIARLEEVAQLPMIPVWLHLLACAAGAGGFCYIMGGDVQDSAAAFLCGILLQCLLLLCAKISLNRFMVNIVGAAWVTLWGAVIFSLGLGHSLDAIIIGCIIPLVPGVALTTAIRDFFNSDYTSGIIHLIDALLIAACIAVGVGASLSLWSMIRGVAL